MKLERMDQFFGFSWLAFLIWGGLPNTWAGEKELIELFNKRRTSSPRKKLICY